MIEYSPYIKEVDEILVVYIEKDAVGAHLTRTKIRCINKNLGSKSSTGGSPVATFYK